MEKAWQQWLDRLYDLRRDNPGSHERPHKPVLLLAIMDLLDRGLVADNRIPLNDDLTKAFRRYFEVVRQHDDKPSIENPFYRLSGDGFWELLPKPGAPPVYQRGNTSGTPSMGALRNTPGRFDQGLWALLEDPHSRHQLREALVARYFPERRDQIAALAAQPSAEPYPAALKEEFRRERDAAFRCTVLRSTISRAPLAACASNSTTSDSLTPPTSFHGRIATTISPTTASPYVPTTTGPWNRRLIAPCPHDTHRAGVWRTSDRLEPRIAGQSDLAALGGKPVIFTGDLTFLPAREGLEWREERLNAAH